MKFSNKIGNLELRSCGIGLIITGVPHDRAEIVEWASDESHCWAIAYWIKGKESYDLKFVGNRPFVESVNKDTFWMLAKSGQVILDQFFEMEEENLS